MNPMKKNVAPARSASFLEMSPSETTPWLLELARSQAGRRRPSDLLAQSHRDDFVMPLALDQRTLNVLDRLALEAAEGFDAVKLSPVAPLGVCSVLAPSSQDRTLSASRGTEVVSDPTNVLALQCAQRLLERPNEPVRLCTLHQVLRAQALPPKEGFSRHFRFFVLSEAGRSRADDAFEVDAFARQAAVFDRFFDLCGSLGCDFPNRRGTLYVGPRSDVLCKRIRKKLGETLGHIELVTESFASSYYDGARLLFGADSISGEHIPIADIGRFDWMAQLTSNRRMRFVASGFGIQLVPLLFRSS